MKKIIKTKAFLTVLVFFVIFGFNLPVLATEVDDIRNHECYTACVMVKGDNVGSDIIKGSTLTEEVGRIRTCLRCLSKDASGDEKTLYTYQPYAKILDMIGSEKDDYYHRLYVTTRKREELLFREKLNKKKGAKDWRSAFSFFSKCPGKLRNLTSYYMDLEDLDNASSPTSQMRRVLKISEEYDRSCAIWLIAGMEQIYPGFIASSKKYGDNYKKEEKDLQKAIDNPRTPAIKLPTLRAEKLGIFIYDLLINDPNSKRPSTTYGFGIYLASTPYSSITHVGNNAGGLVCNIEGKSILNIHSRSPVGKINEKLLIATKILLYKMGKDQSFDDFAATKTAFGIRINTVNANSQYNNFTNPRAFEEAAKQEQSIIYFFSGGNSYFVSKYGIDFSDASCRFIKHTDIFNSCDVIGSAYSKLAQVNFIDFLTFNEDEERRKTNIKGFLTHMNGCFNTEAYKGYINPLLSGLNQTGTNAEFTDLLRDQEIKTLIEQIEAKKP